MDTATTVSVVLSGSDFTADGLTDAHDYVLPTGASGTGTITPATTMTVSITGDPTKPYDGNAGATLSSSDYTVGGLVSGESITVDQTAGTYNSAHVATATTVTADLTGEYTAGTGTKLTNYSLPTSASGAGQITPATPTVTAVSGSASYTGSPLAYPASDVTVTGANGLNNGDGVLSYTYNGSTTVPTAAGSYTVVATFLPTDATDYTTGTGSATWTIYGLDVSQSASSVSEGQSYALVMGNLNLASGAANGYSIAWGDGQFTTVNPGSPATSPANTTVYHTYNDAHDYPVANITVSVLVNYVPVLVAGVAVTVNDVPPSAALFVQYPAAPVSEGTAAQVAVFGGTDPSPQDLPLHYAFDFNGATAFNTGGGDGSYNGSSNTTGIAQVPGSFLDTPGVHTIEGRIIAVDGAYTNYSATITVNNVVPSVSDGTNATGVGVGTTFTRGGTFTDPGNETWTATVDYGDGNGPQNLPLTNKNFNLSHPYAAVGVYTVTVSVTDHYNGSALSTGSSSFTVQVVNTPFQVTAGGFTPTAGGFDVTFDRAADMSKIHLYDGMDNNNVTNQHYNDPSVSTAPLDVTLVGAATGPVHGSLVWDPSTNTAEFVKTDVKSILVGGVPTPVAFIDGVLAPDTYTVTLYSRTLATDPGWEDLGGSPLAGGNYTASFTVAASAQAVLTLPDFARALGEAVNVLRDGTAGHTGNIASNLPITISEGANVTSVDFTLDYNPSYLNITGVDPASGAVSGWTVPPGWSVTARNDAVNGVLTVIAYSTTGLGSGQQTVVGIAAVVPSMSSGTPYGALEVLSLKSVLVNGSAGIGDEAVHKLVFLGDVTGDGTVGATDASRISRVAAGYDTGFYAYPLTDPAIAGDVNGDGVIGGADASDVLQRYIYPANWTGVPEIPSKGYPFGTMMIPAGVDPTVQIGEVGTIAQGGQTVATSVGITDNAAGVQSADFTVSYDTSRLELSDADVALSRYLAAQGWSMAEHVDQATGTVYVALLGKVLPAGTPDLLDLAFHVRDGAQPGTASLGVAGTLNEGYLTMTPVDGSIIVNAANNATSQVSTAQAGPAAGLDGSAVDLLLAAGYQEGATPALATATRAPSDADLPGTAGVDAGGTQSVNLIDSQVLGAAIQGLEALRLGAVQDDLSSILGSRLDPGSLRQQVQLWDEALRGVLGSGGESSDE